MKKHEYITTIEKESNLYFSEIFIDEIMLDEKYFEKLEIVHYQLDYETNIYRNILYKASMPMYLYLSDFDGVYYKLICYFLPTDINKIKIYLNSLLKKQRNASINNTGIKK